MNRVPSSNRDIVAFLRIESVNSQESGFEQGGFKVSLQICRANEIPQAPIRGTLPPCPNIPNSHSRWQGGYNSLITNQGKRIIFPSQQTNMSISENDVAFCRKFIRQLEQEMRQWLEPNADVGWIRIRRAFIKELERNPFIRLVIQSEESLIWKLPWDVWDLLDGTIDSGVEIAFSHLDTVSPATSPSKSPQLKRVIAFFGNSPDHSHEVEKKVLETLRPQANTIIPTDLHDLLIQLREGCEILIFGGHGKTVNEDGFIEFNSECITIASFAEHLKYATLRGLKLTIFNCCDGLGLLEDLRKRNVPLPVIIIMKEEIIDEACGRFFKSFFDCYFIQKKLLYDSFKLARNSLERWEDKFPGITRIPMIYQNPELTPPTWSTPTFFEKLKGFMSRNKILFLILPLLLTSGIVAEGATK